MKQQTWALAAGFEQFGKKTRRALFLEEMEEVVAWGERCSLGTPYEPAAGNGRHPVGLERRLRLYFLQQWFNLSDPALEEALYDLPVRRRFAQVDLGREPVPDETTVCKFRPLLEAHALGARRLAPVNAHRGERGVRRSTGSLVDATIIQAPRSTKNRQQQRDAEMHQTKKGTPWSFGMKAPVGVDSKTTLVHAVVATAANPADAEVRPQRLPGDETKGGRDQAYRGQRKVIHECAPRAKDCTNQRYRPCGVVDEVEREKNRVKSKVRAKVEHVFAVLKLKFGFTKVRYQGLVKNAHRLFVTCALANRYRVRKKLRCPTVA
jgi:IS5 family transposase